jgi:chromosome segregation ATPase
MTWLFTMILVPVQAQQARLDDELRVRAKLSKRLERTDGARRMETMQLREELSRLREGAAEAEARHREAIQHRDVQLAVADSKAAALRSQVEQLEGDVRRMGDQLSTREKELAAMYEERLHLELKQQQLRYDRRLHVRFIPQTNSDHNKHLSMCPS